MNKAALMSRRRRISNDPNQFEDEEATSSFELTDMNHPETAHNLPEQKYVSMSHIMRPEETPEADNDGSLRIFTIPTAEITTITPAGETESAIYSGIFATLQGPPKTKQEVIAELGLEDERYVEFAGQVFDALTSMTAIVAVNGMAKAMTRTWQNPAAYPPVGFASEAEAEAARAPRKVTRSEESFPFEVEPSFERKTTRLFDPDAPMERQDLERILVDSYRTSPDRQRPTPSPGAIYPLDIHVINHGGRVTDEAGEPAFPTGIYQYDAYGLSLEMQKTIDTTSGSSMVEHLARDPDATDPSVWVTLSVDTTAFEQKYGNASQMFIGMSVGSAMQRIVETAEQQGYGTLPLFGIQHHYADDVLQHEDNVKTVLAIGIGKKAPEGDTTDRLGKVELAHQLARMDAGTEDIIKDSGVVNFAVGSYNGMPNGFIGAWAKYVENHGDKLGEAYSFGTDAVYEGALLKAKAEALERAASGNVRVDRAMVTAGELDAPWIDPRVIMPLDNEQAKISSAVQFTPENKLNWTAGTRLGDGTKAYAPSEMIYYPYNETEASVFHATSSGVAAYFGAEEATQRGFLELIERDAIMRTWILQEAPGYIAPETAPESVAHRVNEVAVRGKQIDILDMTQDNGVPVYMAVIRSETFPHFYTGAAAGFDPEKAMHKALDEAIVGFTSRVASEETLKQEDAAKRAAGKFDVDSHGMLYSADAEMAKTLDWLFDGQQAKVPEEVEIPTYQQLIDRYNPAVFELDNPAPGNELNVVRVIAEDLIPVQFGLVGVPYKHHTLPEGTPAPKQHHFFN